MIDLCFGAGNPWRFPLDLVTIEVLPSSHYYDEDYREFNAWALGPIHDFEQHSGYSPVRSTTFPEAGVRVRIYHLAAPP